MHRRTRTKALLALIAVAWAPSPPEALAQGTCVAARSVARIDSALGGVGLPGDTVAITHRRGAQVLLRILSLRDSSHLQPEDMPLDLDVLGLATRAGSAALLVAHSQSHALRIVADTRAPQRLELPLLLDEQSGVRLILAGALGARPLWRVNALRDSMPWGATIGAAWVLGRSFEEPTPTDTILGAGATDLGSAAGSRLWLLHNGTEVRQLDGATPASVARVAALDIPATQLRAANDSVAWVRHRAAGPAHVWTRIRLSGGKTGPIELPVDTTPLTTTPDGALLLYRRESDGLRLFRCE